MTTNIWILKCQVVKTSSRKYLNTLFGFCILLFIYFTNMHFASLISTGFFPSDLKKMHCLMKNVMTETIVGILSSQMMKNWPLCVGYTTLILFSLLIINRFDFILLLHSTEETKPGMISSG